MTPLPFTAGNLTGLQTSLHLDWLSLVTCSSLVQSAIAGGLGHVTQNNHLSSRSFKERGALGQYLLVSIYSASISRLKYFLFNLDSPKTEPEIWMWIQVVYLEGDYREQG